MSRLFPYTTLFRSAVKRRSLTRRVSYAPRRGIHECPVPLFQDEEAPDPAAVVASARRVGGQHPVQHAAVEVTPLGRPRVEQALAGVFFQVGAEPGLSRNSEALFL